MLNWYLRVIRNYANFNGRSRRKEYWVFYLWNLFFTILVLLLDYFIISTSEGGELSFVWLSLLYMMFTFIPYLAVTVRRLHDINLHMGWMFIVFIPLIGPLWPLILLVQPGDPKSNKYGLSPKIIE